MDIQSTLRDSSACSAGNEKGHLQYLFDNTPCISVSSPLILEVPIHSFLQFNQPRQHVKKTPVITVFSATAYVNADEIMVSFRKVFPGAGANAAYQEITPEAMKEAIPGPESLGFQLMESLIFI